MTWSGHSVLAVVPARGGSKSIPRKNLVRLCGKSLVERTASLIAEIGWIDAGVISTDDPEIADEGRRFGLGVPALRPPELADDRAKSIDAWRHAWQASERVHGVPYEISLLLEPTSPLRTVEDLERTIEALINSHHAAAATVSRTPAHFTPHKTLTVDAGGTIGFFHPDGAEHATRQTIPTYFHRNGACYAVWRQTLFERGTIIEHDCAAVIIERPMVNIDEPFDLEIAKWLLGHDCGGST